MPFVCYYLCSKFISEQMLERIENEIAPVIYQINSRKKKIGDHLSCMSAPPDQLAETKQLFGQKKKSEGPN
jgi:hypothetical protein